MVLQDSSVGAGAETRSRCITETVKGSHHFTINGYSLAKGMGVRNSLASESFTVGGHQWVIHFYPDGEDEEDKSEYVSIFIELASKGRNVRALIELTMLDQSTNAKQWSGTFGPDTFDHNSEAMWGCAYFYERGKLEISDYLKNDTLLIRCTVGVVVSSTQGPQFYSIPVPEPDLGQHLGALLDSGEGDVTFEVDGELFQAHKLLLAARSPVFKAQFCGPVGDKNRDKIHIKDMGAPTFKAMLNFIYKDVFPDANEVTGSISSSSTLLAQHLLVAADRYGLDRLRLLCEQSFVKI